MQTCAKWYLARGSNVGQMLPVLHKHFAMIKQKSENERMEQSINHKLKKATVLSHGWKTCHKGWMIQNSGCRIS